MEDKFNAFSTEIKLALLTLKAEVSKEIREASNGVLTEMRERLDRNADERALYNHTLDGRLQHIEKISSETREIARDTNGQVSKHRNILFGEDGGDQGLIGKTEANTKWRNALIAMGGAWIGFLGLMWMVWAPEIQARGILNRPASDYVEFVDARIKQWLPDHPKPLAPAPNLQPNNRDGTKNPN